MTENESIHSSSDNHQILAKALELPCGAVLKNRLAKSAMSDSLGNGEGDPSQAQARLYERWAQGGAALSIIGEVQGNPDYPEKPGNLVFGANSDDQLIHSLVSRGIVNRTHLWPQLGHAGALSHKPISQPVGPSALNLDGLHCTAMQTNEVEQLPLIYATTAAFAKQSGFSGVHLHAGHGFLLSQFLSPLFNHREDQYGGSIEARFHIILNIIDAIREAVGQSYPVGIKINSTDKLEGGLTEDDALEVVRMLERTSIDLIDISGGTYFPGAKSSSDSSSKNGPYFLDFARRAKPLTTIPLMLTGGFENRDQAINALASGDVDVVSLARAMVLNPQLANLWLTEQGGDPQFPAFDSPPRGGVTAWYTMRLTALAQDNENSFTLDPQSALNIYEQRDTQRCTKWMEKFS